VPHPSGAAGVLLALIFLSACNGLSQTYAGPRVPPTLTIVGASVRAAAAAAHHAGWTVHAADLFADADLAAVAQTQKVDDYPKQLEQVISGPQSGEWLYTGGLENYPALIERWSRLRPLLGNPGAVLRAVRDPLRLAARLNAAGLATPQVLVDASQVPSDGSWLQKPCRSAGGTRISRWHGKSVAGQAQSTDCYYQQFVQGMPAAAIYVAARGAAQLLGVTRQILGQLGPAQSGFQYAGSVGPLPLSLVLRRQLQQLGNTLAAEFHLVGVFGVDVIVADDTAWTIEVNPRYTASIEILERCHGLRTLELHRAACVDGIVPPDNAWLDDPAGSCWGKAIVFADADYIAPGEFADLAARSAASACPIFADIPFPGTTIAKGWPIATVFAQSQTEDAPEFRAVLASLTQRAETLRQQCLP